MTPPPSDAGGVVRAAALLAVRLLLVGAAAGTVFALLARLHWLLDDFTSFTVQYAAAGMLGLGGLLALRSYRWAAAACLVVAVNVVQLWPEPRDVPAAKGEPLRLVTANVKTANRDFDRFLRFAREASPDVLLVIEVDAGWAEALGELRDQLPYAFVLPQDDNFGLALLSRVPFDEAQALDIPNRTIVARITHGGRPLTVVGTHPVPPVSSGTAASRNRQFDALAELARGESNEVVLAGDLNVSPWSPHFRDLLRESGLSDSRRGLGVQPTWPAHFPPLRTPIDHVLTSEGLVVLGRRVGPEVGSDHLPVVAEIAFRR